MIQPFLNTDVYLIGKVRSRPSRQRCQCKEQKPRARVALLQETTEQVEFPIAGYYTVGNFTGFGITWSTLCCRCFISHRLSCVQSSVQQVQGWHAQSIQVMQQGSIPSIPHQRPRDVANELLLSHSFPFPAQDVLSSTSFGTTLHKPSYRYRYRTFPAIAAAPR